MRIWVIAAIVLLGVIAWIVVGRKPTVPTNPESAATTVDKLPADDRVPKLILDPSALPVTFKEAPSLAERVAAKDLPPVAERLPDQPAVIQPTHTIGRYGGTWRCAFTGPADGQNIDRIQHNHLLSWDARVTQVNPWIVREWNIIDGGRKFRFHLRKGMKWSDGHPFTTDDIMFWYEDLYQNDQLNPVRANWNQIDGNEGVWEKIDDHTFQVTFTRSYYTFLAELASLGVAGHFTMGEEAMGVFAPKHYLEQFHPKYTDPQRLEELARAEGFDNWVQHFKVKDDPKRNIDCPVTTPWIVTKPINSARMVLERNPYYFVVDTEGNQLPYIDKIVMELAEDLEVLNLRAIAGDYDLQGRHIMLEKAPVLLANQERGNYQVRYWPSRAGTDAGLFVNQTYELDAEIGRWLADRDFRIALSIGIDRDQLNEIFWLGLGQPGSACPPGSSPYSPGDEGRRVHAQYDPDRANEILDGLGLAQRDADGLRQRQDGEGVLVLEIQTTSAAFINWTGIAENVAEQWRRQLGIKAVVQELERSLAVSRHGNNDFQIRMWSNDGSDDPWTFPPHVLSNHLRSWAPLFGRWWESGGQKGREPTPPARRMVELYEQGKGLPADKRYPLGHELLSIYADQAYVIGTVGVSPALMGVWVVSNDMGNVPAEVPFSTPAQTPGNAFPEQFFFRSMNH